MSVTEIQLQPFAKPELESRQNPNSEIRWPDSTALLVGGSFLVAQVVKKDNLLSALTILAASEFTIRVIKHPPARDNCKLGYAKEIISEALNNGPTAKCIENTLPLGKLAMKCFRNLLA